MSTRVFAERYQLDVQIANASSLATWRAIDLLLSRPVTLQLVPPTDPRVPELITRCEQAASNSNRGAVAILDVIANGELVSQSANDEPTILTGVITEWISQSSAKDAFSNRHEPFTSAEALAIVRNLALVMAHAHSMGIEHKRIRPNNVYLGVDGGVRLGGFGVDQVMFGPDEHSDVVALAYLLCALTTGTWPGRPVEGFATLPATTDVSTLIPSDLRSELEPVIDQVFHATVSGQITTALDFAAALSAPRTNKPVASVIRDGANTARGQLSGLPKVQIARFAGEPQSKKRSVLLAGLGVFLFGWAGLQIMSQPIGNSEVPTAIEPLPSASIVITRTPTSAAGIVAITNASDYDPYGDNTENPDQAALAIDSDLTTMWTTVQYRADNMAGKSGVGLLLDLGEAKEVNALKVLTAGGDHSFAVYASDEAAPDVASLTSLAKLDNVTGEVLLEFSKTVTNRYLLLWVTDVPLANGGSYQGGIANLEAQLQ